jgi:hypothetical protein
MATAIYKDDAIAGADKRRDLIAPVATMAEAAMQQDDWRARPEHGIPDPSPIVLYEALLRCDR